MSSKVITANDAGSTLANPLSTYADTTWTLVDASTLANPGAGEYATATIVNGSNKTVYKYTGKAGNTLTGVLWLSGPQVAYAAGSIVDNREPKEFFDAFSQPAADETIPGIKTFSDGSLVGQSLSLVRRTTVPAAPAAGKSALFIHQFASNPGVGLPAWVSDVFSSAPGYLAFSRRSHRLAYWLPGNTAIATQGVQITNTGGAAGPIPTYGINYKDEQSYNTFTTTSAVASVAGVNPSATPNFCVGRSASLERGVWDAVFYWRADASNVYAGVRAFFGFSSRVNDNTWLTGAGGTAMRSAATAWDGLGVGFDASDTDLSIITNDGGAGGGSILALTTPRAKATGIQDKLYVIKMAHGPGDGTNPGGWYVRIEEYDAGYTPTVLFEGQVNTAHMPRAGVALYPYAIIGNANTSANVPVKIGVFECSAR